MRGMWTEGTRDKNSSEDKEIAQRDRLKEPSGNVLPRVGHSNGGGSFRMMEMNTENEKMKEQRRKRGRNTIRRWQSEGRMYEWKR